MKQTIKRMSCLLLALCLLLTLIPVSARAEEESQGVDFVLVLDCSGSMAKNDKQGLAAVACKQLMDFLPIENARVAVIAYGFNGEGYDYTHFEVEYDANVVQTLSPLSLVGEMTDEQKDALKNSIASVTGKTSSAPTSAIGQALAAGVDTLLSGDATDGNACVILLTDGDATSQIAAGEASALADSVPFVAKEHGWPIFCIELDYQGKNGTSEGAANRRRLTNICVNSGAGEAGRMVVSNPAEVSNALLTIYDYFMETETALSENVVIGQDGTASREFEVPELASESNILVSGGAVEYVELVDPNGATRKITASESKGDWIANVETDEYISVKVVRPQAGTWIVKAYGDPNASIYVRSGIIRELDLALIGDPNPTNRVTKNDTIRLQSYFTYHGGSMNNSGFYAENPANLIVTSRDSQGNVKSVKEYTMTGDTSGYHFDLNVSEIPSGVFTVAVQLKHPMFRTGEKTSDVLTYTSENLPLEHDESQVIDRSGYVNATLEEVHLPTVFPNPDGDPIEYVIECVSDHNVIFETEIDDDDDLLIHTGLHVGTHQMQVKATDPDMTEPMVHDFTITVENRPIESKKKIPDQEVWVDYYNNFFIKQDPSNTVLDINLNDYFTDPDGVELTFGDIKADVAGLVDASWKNGVLHVEPMAEGDVVLTTTVSDGVETVDAKIEIEVVDGKVVYWKTHWIYYAIAGVIALIILVILLSLYKNKLVKGNWNITITDNNSDSCTYSNLNIVAATNSGKKHKFTLLALLQEIIPFMTGDNAPKNSYIVYFSGAAGRMELVGTYSKRGCGVRNVPKDAVTVRVNSLERRGKIVFSGGRLTFEISHPSNPADKLTVTMDLCEK